MKIGQNVNGLSQNQVVFFASLLVSTGTNPPPTSSPWNLSLFLEGGES